MPESAATQPLYRARMRTSIYGARLGLDDDGMLIGHYGTEDTSGDLTWKFSLRANGTAANTYVALDGFDLIIQYGA